MIVWLILASSFLVMGACKHGNVPSGISAWRLYRKATCLEACGLPSWDSAMHLCCIPVEFAAKPDCRPPARYFPGSINVNPGALQYILTIKNICQMKCITSERCRNAGQKAANVCAHEYNKAAVIMAWKNIVIPLSAIRL